MTGSTELETAKQYLFTSKAVCRQLVHSVAGSPEVDWCLAIGIVKQQLAAITAAGFDRCKLD
jgi:hypothetical protein